MTIAEKIQRLRRQRGWSQEELASRLPVSRQALSKWESGAAIPDTENVLLLSRLFDVTTDDLLYDEWDEIPRERGSQGRGGKRRAAIIAGVCLLLVSAAGLLALGILSSVYPATYIESPAGVEWIRAVSGFFGFLLVHRLTWLAALCAVGAAAGIVLLLWNQITSRIRRIKK